MMEMKEILERIESFDECIPKSRFLDVLDKYPDLKAILNDLLSLDKNQEWMKKAEKERFFFLIYDNSWKVPNICCLDNSICLKFISSLPVISINIHKKPV